MKMLFKEKFFASPEGLHRVMKRTVSDGKRVALSERLLSSGKCYDVLIGIKISGSQISWESKETFSSEANAKEHYRSFCSRVPVPFPGQRTKNQR